MFYKTSLTNFSNGKVWKAHDFRLRFGILESITSDVIAGKARLKLDHVCQRGA